MISSLWVYSNPLKNIPHAIPAGKTIVQPSPLKQAPVDKLVNVVAHDTTMKAAPSPKKEENQVFKAENADATPLDESLVMAYSKKNRKDFW